MPVQLQSDLLTSEFWQAVRDAVRDRAEELKLSDWTIVIRPRSRHDDYFCRDPETFGLTPREAKQIDRSSPDVDVDESTQLITMVVPDTEDWCDPACGQRHMIAFDLADALMEDVEILLDDEPE